MQHRAPSDFSDRFALAVTMFFRWFADTFFAKRYGHRAVVLETVAGVPGMVAGMWSHLSSLRKMKQDDRGWIKTLLDEAENERMHLMIFIEIAKPLAKRVSRSLPASDEAYSLIGLSPKASITTLALRWAARTNTMSLPSPFSLK